MSDAFDKSVDMIARRNAEIKSLRKGNRDLQLHFDVLKADYCRLRTQVERFRAALGHIADERLSSSDEVRYLKQFARSVLDDQSEPSSWRSIETAPKDGSEVLMVFVFEDGEVLHRVVWWDGSEMWPWRDEYTGYREGEAKGWMPLLPAPGKEEV